MSLAIYSTKLENAEKTALTAMPARISFAAPGLPPILEINNTRKEAASAPKNAMIPTELLPNTVPIPSMMARVAPRVAPEEIPST